MATAALTAPSVKESSEVKRGRRTFDGITLLSLWKVMAFLSWKRSPPSPFK